MHKISHIEIENFKSISKADFPLSGYTPLVGYNNAGKTNILKALSWLVKKSSLGQSDFHDQSKPVIVKGVVRGVTDGVLASLGDTHRKKIENLIIDGEIHFKRTQQKPGVKSSEISLEVLVCAGDGSKKWEKNPAGIDVAISKLFPDPIYVGAMENAAEDVGKFATGTTIGKLIKEIVEPITKAQSDGLEAALEVVAQKLSADGDEKDQTLVDLDNKIESALGSFFPGISVKTHIQTPNFSDFLKGATVRLFEDGYDNSEGRDAASFGHGAQRSIQIALIKCLADIKKSDGDGSRTTLLLIDEPELYLHPQAVEMVRLALRKLSGDGYQVIFSTHSPSMISREYAPKALLIRRNREAGTHAYPRIEDAVSAALEGADHQANTLFELSNASKLLFSEKVFLVEGKTERTILPELYMQEFECTLEEKKIGIVSLGGVDNVPNAIKVLSAIGIPTKTVVDLDFAFRSAILFDILPADHYGIRGCFDLLRNLSEEKKIKINEKGLPVSSEGVSASQAFAMMAREPDAAPYLTAIHAHLADQGIWCWLRGDIEQHLGLSSKSASVHRGFLDSCKTEGFLDSLPDYSSVKDMLNWLNQ